MTTVATLREQINDALDGLSLDNHRKVLACTPRTSPGTIDALLTTKLAQAGWQH